MTHKTHDKSTAALRHVRPLGTIEPLAREPKAETRLGPVDLELRKVDGRPVLRSERTPEDAIIVTREIERRFVFENDEYF